MPRAPTIAPIEVALVTGDKPDAPGLDSGRGRRRAGRAAATPRTQSQLLATRSNEALEQADIDLIALAGFMRIIPDDFLARWEGRIVNIHPSLLPKHKGLRTHEACLAAGDKVTGATVHLVTPELDGGEILGQVEVAVLPDDTPETLAERVLIAEHQLYPRVLSQYRRPRPRLRLDRRSRSASWRWRCPKPASRPATARPAGRSAARAAASSSRSCGTATMARKRSACWSSAAARTRWPQLIEAEPDLYFRPDLLRPVRLDRHQARPAAGRLGPCRDWLAAQLARLAPPRLTKLMRAADEF